MITDEDLKQQFYKGDTIILPFEFEQGEISEVADFSDFTKIEIEVSSFNQFIATFTTDEESAIDEDHLIVIDDPSYQNFDLLVPSDDTLQMQGDVILKVRYYFLYNDKEMVQTKRLATNIEIIE